MKKYKYYHTMMMLKPKEEISEEYKIPWHVRQFGVTIKAFSYAEAERKCIDIVGFNGFCKAYTSESGNKTCIEECDKHDAIAWVDNKRTVPLKDFIE